MNQRYFVAHHWYPFKETWDKGRAHVGLAGSLDVATVDGIALRKGDRVEWEGFGGIAWTGRGEIVGLFREYDGEGWPPPGVVLAVRFDRSEELDEWQRKIQETAGSGCFAGSGPYPFGDDVGEPVVFTAVGVTEAVRSGKLRVLGRVGTTDSLTDPLAEAAR